MADLSVRSRTAFFLHQPPTSVSIKSLGGREGLDPGLGPTGIFKAIGQGLNLGRWPSRFKRSESL
ncbi:hypothetical protein PGT21_016316 [Puccinia graminis f. sp. tritici]|uniref:Uncharacterized protein n=1 Tax=Puccinia graminis f. sp. tritici TaxID=56615 RepID=A0A5B0Q5P3_PUCGR|nr:hypothetical protein PGT21_016316 [Puccinia graminis f. sp. tritici]